MENDDDSPERFSCHPAVMHANQCYFYEAEPKHKGTLICVSQKAPYLIEADYSDDNEQQREAGEGEKEELHSTHGYVVAVA